MHFIHNDQTGVLEYGELMFSKVYFVIFCPSLALMLLVADTSLLLADLTNNRLVKFHEIYIFFFFCTLLYAAFKYFVYVAISSAASLHGKSLHLPHHVATALPGDTLKEMATTFIWIYHTLFFCTELL